MQITPFFREAKPICQTTGNSALIIQLLVGKPWEAAFFIEFSEYSVALEALGDFWKYLYVKEQLARRTLSAHAHFSGHDLEATIMALLVVF